MNTAGIDWISAIFLVNITGRHHSFRYVLGGMKGREVIETEIVQEDEKFGEKK